MEMIKMLVGNRGNNMAVTVPDVLNKLDKDLFYLQVEDDPTTENTDESVEGVTEVEVNSCITDATIQATTHIKLTNTDDLPSNPIIENAVATWAAGLLWNMKLSTEAPQYADDRNGDTYGDKKIKEAKAILDVFLYKDNNETGDVQPHKFADII